MTAIKDAAGERLKRIERTLQRLQGEMDAVREESRALAEELRQNARVAARRAQDARTSAVAIRERAEAHLAASAERLGKKSGSRQMAASKAAFGRAQTARDDADSAHDRAVDISDSSGQRTRRNVQR